MKNTIKSSLNTHRVMGSKKLLHICMQAAFCSGIGFVSLSLPLASVAQESGQNVAGLNFVNADIESVIKAVGHYTGTTFVIDPRVKGQLTLVAEKPLTKEQAFKLLTSNLRMQGFAVVTSDGFSKVVPEADAKLQGGPTQAKGVKGDQIITQVFRINYEAANNIVTALRPLISPNNVINVNPGNNSIVITDYADNMRRMSEVIALLDVPSNPEIEIIPIKHSIASDVATMVTRLSENNSQAGADAGKTIVLADSRTNSVLIKSPSVARSNLVKSLVAQLDQPTTQPGNIHVVYLKNAEAVKLASTLRSILSGESALPSNTGVSNSNLGFGNNSQTNMGGAATQGNNSALGSSGTTLSLPISANNSNQAQGGGGGFIQADPATNTLIITASDSVYRNLRGVIDQLDARRAQVYIETIIVEVSASKTAELGVEWAGVTGDSTSNYRLGAVTSNQGNLINLADPTKRLGTLATGFNVGLFRQIGGQLGIGAVLKAIENDNGTNLLSMPNLVTLDNEEATIVDGKTIGLVTGQYTSATTGTAGANPFQTIERKEIGIKLKVKPQISESGTVKLSIAQEVSDVSDAEVKGSSGPVTTVRQIATNVLVEDGQIIALGGLIRDDTSGKENKVPLLGDIPFLGNLFKYQKKTRDKVNLMVFLRPTVIRTAEDSSSVSLDRYDYLRTQYLRSMQNETDVPFLKMEKGRLMTPAEPSSADKVKSVNKEGK